MNLPSAYYIFFYYRLRRLSEEHEEQLSASTERALNARKQTLSLQSQLALTQ